MALVCNQCSRDIENGTPVVLLNIGIAGATEEEFTGVAWHPDCAPAERYHLLDEAERVSRQRAEAAPSGAPREAPMRQEA